MKIDLTDLLVFGGLALVGVGLGLVNLYLIIVLAGAVLVALGFYRS